MIARPILFSAAMVRALLSGAKTQTRRALKKQPLDILPMEGDKAGREWIILDQREPEPKGKVIHCRFGVPGDFLWVRETHAIVGNVDPGWVLYRANGYESECRRHRFDSPPPESEITWKPSIHMPRWASRLTLRITNVRVERLNDISEADARAEGVSFGNITDQTTGEIDRDAIEAYEKLWESINGPRSWARNDWVWCLSFEVIRANVDDVLKRVAA